MNPFKRKLLAIESVALALSVAQQAQTKFQTELAPLIDLIFPQAKVERLKIAAQQLTTPQELEIAREEIAKWESSGAEAGIIPAKKMARQLREEFRKTLPPLLDAAGEALTGFLDDAEEAEKKLFAQFDMSHEPTPISKSVRKLQSELVHLRNCIEPRIIDGNLLPSRNNFANVVNWFAE